MTLVLMLALAFLSCIMFLSSFHALNENWPREQLPVLLSNNDE